jgi:hypothetical protein
MKFTLLCKFDQKFSGVIKTDKDSSMYSRDVPKIISYMKEKGPDGIVDVGSYEGKRIL